MKNTLKKTLSIILSVVMLAALTVTAFAAGKNVVIEMQDAYEDGWEGNAILISKVVDGNFEPVERVTMDGDNETVELELSDSDNYVFQWIPGNCPWECSFEIAIDGKTVVSVKAENAFFENDVIYIDCEHNVVGNKCTICGFECGIAFPHGYSSETGICACGAVCTHLFVSTGLCKFCGMECSHEEYVELPVESWFVSGTPGIGYDEDASYLFDGNVYTKWCTEFSTEECPYFIFSYGVPVKLVSYTMTTALDTANYPERNWIDWTVYGSDSEDGEWTVVHDVKDSSLPADSLTESEAFEVNADTAYTYYKVVVNSNGGEGEWGNSQQMSEFVPVVDTVSYYGCSICGKEYKEPVQEEETTQPDDSEDASEICSFCGKEHENLLEEIICLIMEFFHLVKEAFRISL